MAEVIGDRQNPNDSLRLEMNLIRLLLPVFIGLISSPDALTRPQQPPSVSLAKYRKPIISTTQIQIGPSIIFFHGNPYDEEARVFKGGYAIHFSFNHRFNQKITTVLQVGHENKGFKTIVHSLNTDYTPPAKQRHISDVTLNYFTAALIGKCMLTKSEKFFLGIGPYFGYLHSTRFQKELFLNGVLFANRQEGLTHGYRIRSTT